MEEPSDDQLTAKRPARRPAGALPLDSPAVARRSGVRLDSAAHSEPVGFRFGGRLLDLRRGELRSYGRPVALERRALKALIYLVRHRSRVVSRRELILAVWGVPYVSDNALSRVISLVRAALRDHKRPHRFLFTSYGKGYRFVAPVRVLGPGDLRDRTTT